MSEEEFHKQRRMFVISVPPGKLTGVAVWWAEPGDLRSHSQWFKDRGWDWADDRVRGFVDETGIYFYRGPDYSCDLITRESARYFLPEIQRTVPLPVGTRVYAGMTPGPIGERWKPRLLITTVGAP